MKPLGLLLALRFLGLFIVLPVLSYYALKLPGATPFLAGVAVGAYALAQMFFQTPIGWLGDRIDKKKILIVGFFLLGIGSLISAYGSNIYWLILGRFLQGTGAIGGIILAYIAEVVEEEERAKSFAFVGQFIALSFAISMVAGPLIGGKWGVDKLFLFTAFLSIVAIGMVLFLIPPTPQITHHQPNPPLREMFQNRELLKLLFTGFMQKGLMTTFFMLVPILFIQTIGWEKEELWKIYLPALVVGIFALPLGAILAEKKGRVKLVFVLSSGAMVGAIGLFAIDSVETMIGAVILFFFGFNLMEPVLQSFVSKVVKANQKATALSLSNTIQYFGIFLGGAVSGYFLKQGLLFHFLIGLFLIGMVWVTLLVTFRPPIKLRIVKYSSYNSNLMEKLKQDSEVYDFYEKDGVLIVRYLN